MNTQTFSHPKAPQTTPIPHETDLYIRLAELLTDVPAPTDPIGDTALEGLIDLPGMDPALLAFYTSVLPGGFAPVACVPFWPCA